MSRHHSHIATAIKIIEAAVPGEPLVHHLKKFFAADKKFGSKDRKAIASLCYGYYRIGNALAEKTKEEKIIAAAFLCSLQQNDLLVAVAPELNEKTHWPFHKKIDFLQITYAAIFSFATELSEEINKEVFAFSLLQQPLVFLRLRPGKSEKIYEKLTDANIAYKEISVSCIALQPGAKLDDVIKINKDAVVQDRNSQQVFDYLQKQEVFLPKDAEAWDCCAASGGKSILLHDLLHGHVKLHVSDVRENILLNLKNRFADAGIKNYSSFIADLQNDNPLPPKEYDLVICDAPCSGSGTWARTPEQLCFFKEKQISEYAAKQKKIASAALVHVKKGGLFFYITCSVFKKENEDVVAYLTEKFRLQCLQTEYLKGYDKLADTMFTAVFTK